MGGVDRTLRPHRLLGRIQLDVDDIEREAIRAEGLDPGRSGCRDGDRPCQMGASVNFRIRGHSRMSRLRSSAGIRLHRRTLANTHKLSAVAIIAIYTCNAGQQRNTNLHRPTQISMTA